MPDMAKHASSTSGLRRARAAAWIVFLSMAGTTMTFQVYHSIEYGRMPWPLAALYGVVPLLISICILEVIAEWRGSPAWAKWAAYAIMAGAMFMSASATGEVVLHAAPQHWSLLFGLLLDAAALFTVHFLLSGAHAVSRTQAEAEAARRAELASAYAAADSAAAARAVAETERDAAVSARETAVREAAEALTRAEAIAQRLTDASVPKARKQPVKAARGSACEGAQADDPTTELRALMELRADPELWKPRMGGKLAELLGVSPATGRRYHSRFVKDGTLNDPFAERSADERDERSGERS